MATLKRLNKELADMGKNPDGNVSAGPLDEKDPYQW